MGPALRWQPAPASLQLLGALSALLFRGLQACRLARDAALAQRPPCAFCPAPRRITRGAPNAAAKLAELTECRNCLLEHVALVMLSGNLLPLSEILLYALDEDDSVYAPTNGPRRRPTSADVPYDHWWAARGADRGLGKEARGGARVQAWGAYVGRLGLSGLPLCSCAPGGAAARSTASLGNQLWGGVWRPATRQRQRLRRQPPPARQGLGGAAAGA
jgi:hypothetical protein